MTTLPLSSDPSTTDTSSLSGFPLQKQRTSKVGYLTRAVVLSFGVSQILSPLVILAKAVSSVWNIAKIAILSVRVARLNAKITRADTKATPKQTVQALELMLSCEKAKRQEAIATLKQNGHGIVIALLGLLPGVGLIAGGAYAHYMDIPGLSPKNTADPITRGAEGVSQHLLGSCPGLGWIGRKCVYPLSFAPARKAYEREGLGEWIFDSLNRDSQNMLLQVTPQRIKQGLGEIFFKTVKKQLSKDELQAATKTFDRFIQEIRPDRQTDKTPFTKQELIHLFTVLGHAYFEHKVTSLGGVPLSISVERGDGKPHGITCQYINNGNPRNQTMVIFHGNGMMGESMSDVAALYKEKGWNVVLVSMGGYPGSDSSIHTSEATTIQDVHAVLQFLEQQQGVTKIGCHGFSIGGTLAMHATKLSKKVQFVVLDKTLDSIQGGAANMVQNIAQECSLLKIVPSAIIRGLMANAFPRGIDVPGVVVEGQPYQTDGCDNISKAESYEGVLVTIGGNEDFVMGSDWSQEAESSICRHTFSDDLAKAHQKNHPGKSVSRTTEQKHDCEITPLGCYAIEEGLSLFDPERYQIEYTQRLFADMQEILTPLKTYLNYNVPKGE